MSFFPQLCMPAVYQFGPGSFVHIAGGFGPQRQLPSGFNQSLCSTLRPAKGVDHVVLVRGNEPSVAPLHLCPGSRPAVPGEQQ